MKLFAKSQNGKLLKIGEISEKAGWFFMTPQVTAFMNPPEPAKCPIALGDEVTIETTSENGSAFVTKITKGSAPATPKPAAPQPKAETTGSTQNAGNGFNTPANTNGAGYKTPYLPREEWEAKMKAEGKWKSGTSSKTPEEQNTIKRQAIGHMTSRSLASMQGIITPDNIEEIITKLYAKYVELVG